MIPKTINLYRKIDSYKNENFGSKSNFLVNVYEKARFLPGSLSLNQNFHFYEKRFYGINLLFLEPYFFLIFVKYQKIYFWLKIKNFINKIEFVVSFTLRGRRTWPRTSIPSRFLGLFFGCCHYSFSLVYYL